MKRKKRGSSLLMVLAIAMIIFLLGATVTSAVVYAMKANTLEKEDRDLIYAAESGVEQAVTNVRKNDGHEEDDFELPEFAPKNIEVNVEVTKDDSGSEIYYPITSVATEFQIALDGSRIYGNSRTVKARVKKTYDFSASTDNLLKYSICGNNVNMYVNGSYDGNTSMVNGASNININKVGDSPVNVPGTDRNQFKIPDPKVERRDETIVINGISNKIISTTVNDPSLGERVPAITEFEAEIASGRGGIQRITHKIQGGNLYQRNEYISIYFVNAPRLDLVASQVVLKNVIIMCNSTVNAYARNSFLSNMNEDGTVIDIARVTNADTVTFDFNASNIVANNANLYVNGFTTRGAIYGNDANSPIYTNPAEDPSAGGNPNMALEGIIAAIGLGSNEFESGVGGTIVWHPDEFEYDY